MSRRRRTPTGEEIALWEKVTETVAPLTRKRPKPADPEPAATPAPPKPKPKPKAPPPPVVVRPSPPVKPPQAPTLAPIDRRTRLRLGRGTVAIDRRIDLHGMTQMAAEERLRKFLVDAQLDGAKMVLVITGKGKSGGEGERGVLRRVVPMWLAAPHLRSVVVGFDEAGPTHGGSGALYVRIRKLRG